MAYARYPAVSGATYAATVVTAVAANTKGAYTELTASTSADGSFWYVAALASSLVNQAYLLDIATGAAASETVIVANIPVYAGAASGSTASFIVPIDRDIASGTRLSARCQSESGGSDQLFVWILHQDRALSSLSTVATYGANTATSFGTAVDAGATINTKGAYAELTASTSADHNVLVLIVTNPANTGPAIANFSLDIATGAASSEVIIVPDIAIRSDQSGDWFFPSVVRLPVDTISAGTRLACRCQSTTNDATDRVLSVALLGMTAPTSGGGGGGAHASVWMG